MVQLFGFSLIKYRMYLPISQVKPKGKLTSASYLINLPAMSTILAYSAKFGRL